MENGTDDDSCAVRVAVRIRPLIGREKVDRCDECVSVVEDEMQIVMGKNRSFTYDYVFSKYAQQSDIWRCVEPLVKSHFDGYNATIFAYGQTGSGKTFTMGSGSCVHVAPEDYGIIPRVIGYLFDQIDAKTLENPRYKAELRVRFLEVYGEEIRDLLVQFSHDGQSDTRVTLREGEGGEVQVVGASEEMVTDADECLRLLERGTLCRTTGSTLMNAHSSRSHAIFTVSMVQHVPVDATMVDGDEPATEQLEQDQEYETRTSYFNFVDLAGSERQKRTQAEGKRLKEGIDINKGLLALGNVISALGDDKKRGKVHVPYRDSKLTRMLQDSLGGNSRTLMLACVSPADVNFEETLNALKYANRARNIRNKPVVNRDEASAMTAELRRQVQMLQAEVFRLRNPGLSESELRQATAGASSLIGMPMDFDSYGNLRSRAETAESEVSRLTGEIKRYRTQMDHMKEEMIAAQAERDYLRLCVEESQGSGSPTASMEEREAKSNVLKQHLRTICDLQDQLREVERERDRALMNLSESGLLGSGVAALVAAPLPSDAALKMDDDLLARAEKAIEKEHAMLSKLKGEDATEDAAYASDASGNEDADMDTGDDGQGTALDASQAEEEADRHRVFQRRQQHLGQSVQDLAHEISLKEQLMQNIRQNQENYERMKNYYEQKMSQMVEEVRIAQLDRDKLIDEIQQLEMKIRNEGDATGGGSGRLAKLAKELKSKETELQGLRKKQTEMNRYMNQKKKNDTQMRVLNAEITNMKRQKVDLIKKMQDERKRFEEEANRRRREITSLKRSQQRDKQHIQRLGSQKEAQERVLKRKMQEISAAKARLKHQQQLQAQARKMNSSYGRHKQTATGTKAERDAKWLGEEVKKRAEEQQKLEQLQRDREAVAKEMEALYAARDKLEDELRRSFSSQNNIRDVLISPMKSVSPAPSPIRRLSGSGRQEYQLTPEEEQLLYDLEERIESCQAQLEYKEEKISEIADEDRHAEGIVKIESTQSLPEARTLLKMMFGMAVDVKKQDQRKEQELAKLHVEMAELTKNLEQEREKTQQLKLGYEESLQRVVQGGLEADGGDAVDNRERVLLSVSEERNAILRKKCDELEFVKRQVERDDRTLQERMAKQQADITASREQIKWLEEQLASVRGRIASNQASSRDNSQLKPRSKPFEITATTAVAKKPPFSAPNSVTKFATTGRASWANEFDDDDDEDEDVAMDEDIGHAHGDDDDVEMKDDSSIPLPSGQSLGRRDNRREYRVDLDGMEDNLDSISLSERHRLAQQRADDDDDDGARHPFLKEDSPTLGSDDSSSTSTTNTSIFSRLANPTNFTGIHKARVKDSVSKREVLQKRAERNRTRRQRDRTSLRPPRALTPTERTSSSGFGVKSVPRKTTPMLEVLANMKRENESEHFPAAPAFSPAAARGRSQSAVHTAAQDIDANSDVGGAVVPPPAPQMDVYSRLAGAYTTSAQNKRQRAVPVSRRGAKQDDPGRSSRSPSREKSSATRASSMDDDVDAMEQRSSDSGSVDAGIGSYDPLIGGESLVAQVHDDYRERLSHRSSSMTSLNSTRYS